MFLYAILHASIPRSLTICRAMRPCLLSLSLCAHECVQNERSHEHVAKLLVRRWCHRHTWCSRRRPAGGRGRGPCRCWRRRGQPHGLVVVHRHLEERCSVDDSSAAGGTVRHCVVVGRLHALNRYYWSHDKLREHFKVSVSGYFEEVCVAVGCRRRYVWRGARVHALNRYY